MTVCDFRFDPIESSGVHIRVVALALTALCSTLALAGCVAEPVPAAAQPTAQPPTATVRPTLTSTPIASLPPAPPLDSWVVKTRSGFQMTLDLDMQTAMISRLDIDPADVDEASARALAYFICRGLRADPAASPFAVVQRAYPRAGVSEAFGVALAAQGFCLDTVDV